MNDIIKSICQYAKNDFNVYPLRFILEVLAWITSISCSITMAFTVPNPPFLILYPLFISQCMVFCWAAWTRKSFSMVGNYVLIISIDMIAFIRLLTG